MAVSNLRFKLVSARGFQMFGKTSLLLRYTENEFPSTLLLNRSARNKRSWESMARTYCWKYGTLPARSGIKVSRRTITEMPTLHYWFTVWWTTKASPVCGDYWLKETQRYLPDETTIPIQLVGNKCDLVPSDPPSDDAVVPLTTAVEYTEAYGNFYLPLNVVPWPGGTLARRLVLLLLTYIRDTWCRSIIVAAWRAISLLETKKHDGISCCN